MTTTAAIATEPGAYRNEAAWERAAGAGRSVAKETQPRDLRPVDDRTCEAAVQARLGHAWPKTSLDTYGHLFPDEEDRTRAAIDLALGTPADNPRTELGTGT